MVILKQAENRGFNLLNCCYFVVTWHKWHSFGTVAGVGLRLLADGDVIAENGAFREQGFEEPKNLMSGILPEN